jgi:hypothetical protein
VRRIAVLAGGVFAAKIAPPLRRLQLGSILREE